MSTAIIPMTQSLGWDPVYAGAVLSSFWGGYALTQVLGGKLSDKWGGEKVLLFAILAWSLCTFATPWAATFGAGTAWSAVPILAVRVLLGAGEGLAFPAIHSMTNKYVENSFKGTSTAIITSACYVGALLSNLVSPGLIVMGGYKLCFELFALIPPLFWLPGWIKFMIDRGSEASRVSEPIPSRNGEFRPLAVTEEIVEEQDSFIVTTPTVVSTERVLTPLATTAVQEDELSDSSDSRGVLSVPQLLTFPSVWAIIGAQYCQSWGMIGLLSWLPTYYSDRFHVPLSALSQFTVLPYFLQMVVSIGAGYLADYLINSDRMPKLLVRQVFQIVGMLGPALCLAYCAYIPTLTAGSAYKIINLGSALSALT